MTVRVTQAFSEVLKGVSDAQIVYRYIQLLAQNLHNSNQGFITVKILNRYLEDYPTKLTNAQNPLPDKKHVFSEYI